MTATMRPQTAPATQTLRFEVASIGPVPEDRTSRVYYRSPPGSAEFVVRNENLTRLVSWAYDFVDLRQLTKRQTGLTQRDGTSSQGLRAPSRLARRQRSYSFSSCFVIAFTLRTIPELRWLKAISLPRQKVVRSLQQLTEGRQMSARYSVAQMLDYVFGTHRYQVWQAL